MSDAGLLEVEEVLRGFDWSDYQRLVCLSGKQTLRNKTYSELYLVLVSETPH
mgnify:CR=1 FL=1